MRPGHPIPPSPRVVAAIRDSQIAEHRAAGSRVAVLYLDGDRLLDAPERLPRAEFQRALASRIAFAERPGSDGVGEPFAAHLRSMLLRQNLPQPRDPSPFVQVRR